MRESQKVSATHLARKAYLYVRQSTLRQVLENRESTQRQYALRERALALGWPADQIVVVDCDLGQSGASAADREGFQRLVSEVGLGRVGIVLGLEVSRLARNNSDWHRLLEICALTHTLILDEDGLYDPGHFNDRLLLGLKGTMSEAELHVLQARLRGGSENKARRGELRVPLPAGFVYAPDGRVALDPDRQVQDTIRLFFETFQRLRSASATAKDMRDQGIRFPRRSRVLPDKGELVWVDMTTGIALQTLHNPRYTGAYVFGRHGSQRLATGAIRGIELPQNEWRVVIHGAHAAYITWEQYQENRRCLQQNSNAYGLHPWPHPPREGPALLQGIVVCGLCGAGMSPRYHREGGGRRVPYYCCRRANMLHHRDRCQVLPGKTIDDAVGRLLLDTLTPLALETALAVQEEMQARLEAADRLRRQQVDRTQYEADLARRRYMQVDPENRLVADSLEAEWNSRLRALRDCQEEYERQRADDRRLLDEEQQKAIRELASDVPRIWNDPSTSPLERKRIARLLLEDVTLTRDDAITVHIRFRGGTTHTLTLSRPLSAPQLRKTDAEIVRLVDALLEENTDAGTARILNERGLRSGTGKSFRRQIIKEIRLAYELPRHSERLRRHGYLTIQEIADKLGVSTSVVNDRRAQGRLKGRLCNDHGEYLFEEPTAAEIFDLLTPIPPTSPDVIRAIDELLEEHTERQVARLLNERGLRSATGQAFTARRIQQLRVSHGLLPREERLRRRGLITTAQLAERLGVTATTIRYRRSKGLLKGYLLNDKGEHMFQMVDPNPREARRGAV